VFAIIGAGITGCVLARALAEQGYPVVVFEATQRAGGVAYQGNYRTALSFHAEHFLTARTSLRWLGMECERKIFSPQCNWRYACRDLLLHKNISYWHSSPIYDLPLVKETFSLFFCAARLDWAFRGEYGLLSYISGFPVRSPDDLVLYTWYKEQVAALGGVCVGMGGLYKYMTIDECICHALDIAREFGYLAIDKQQTIRIPIVGKR